jgi:two-component system chemotaxis sensor kinase CheA
MDDYFAEAEEHMIAVKRSLLALEASIGSKLPVSALEELFRSFHSLKGISAMVELREAELLAHQMESCLRVIREGHVAVTSTNFETLVDGAKVLEAVIVAHRSGQPVPPVGHFLEQLESLARSGTTPSAAEHGPVVSRESNASGSDIPLWKVTFTPSPELVARGIKIDTVRSRLLHIGQVLNVVPKVLPGGGVSFEFEVETNGEHELAAWKEDGITYTALRPTTNVTAPASDASPSGSVSRPATGGEGPQDMPTAGRTNFVRVDLARLDDLMRLVGDMVVTRARLEDTLQRVERHVPFQEWRDLQEHSSGIERQLRDLREGVMRVRLVPIGEIFRRMPFVVRDLARDTGKRVQLDLVGQATEIDKFLIERMMDPVLHLVRNAISHAIEPSDQRAAAGKPPEGTIRLSATTAGESVVLEITDDGSGIDVHAVAERARARGMSVPDGSIDARALLDIICAPGFSTRDEADRGSGRGVGMSVVRRTVEELGGTLGVQTEAGRGTTFQITLPLTLAITDAIIAHVGDHTFAVPQSAVREVIEVDTTALRAIERNELLTYRGGTLPIVRLAQLFSIPVQERPRFHALVVGVGLAAIGLLVDRIAGQREIVVKTITDPLIHVHGVSGATELGDGRLVLILDVSALSRTLRDRPHMAEGMSA